MKKGVILNTLKSPVDEELALNACKEEMRSTKTKSKGKGLLDGGYLYPAENEVIYHGIKYCPHALERMAPPTREIVELLLYRSFAKMDSAAHRLNLESILNNTSVPFNWWRCYIPQPRGILPKTVEQELRFPGSTLVRVIAEEGIIKTVIPRKERELNDCDEIDQLRIKYYGYYDPAFELIPTGPGYVKYQSILVRVEKYAHHLSSKFSFREIFAVTEVNEEGIREDEEIKGVVLERKDRVEGLIFGVITVRDRRPIGNLLEDCKLNGIIERKAKYVRNKSLSLTTEFHQWEKATENRKSNRGRGVDIRAWKEGVKNAKKQKIQTVPVRVDSEIPRMCGAEMSQPATKNKLDQSEELSEESSSLEKLPLQPSPQLLDSWEDI